jgi:putative glutathione S-transferase
VSAAQFTAAQFSRESSSGAFVRQPNRFTDRITSDGSSPFPVKAGRYVLYACLACPWAHRSIIVRSLLGLEEALALRIVDPIRDDRGWRFTLDEGGVDPVTGAAYAMELYRRTDPDYDGRATVPFVWDTVTERIVTNDYPQLTLDLSTQWKALHAPDAPNLYPEHLRQAIDEMAAANYSAINNGVYKAGFATTQDAYEDAYQALFTRLHELDALLEHELYLVGRVLTEADVRLFTTLVRFDAVYHGHFKSNERKLTEFVHLWPYTRDLFATPGFGSTTNVDHIKRHYYATHDRINPTRIVPKGPDLSGWTEPHGRDQLR